VKTRDAFVTVPRISFEEWEKGKRSKSQGIGPPTISAIGATKQRRSAPRK
jgi:hypothetical protein